jgi:hypothetical protein
MAQVTSVPPVASATQETSSRRASESPIAAAAPGLVRMRTKTFSR